MLINNELANKIIPHIKQLFDNSNSSGHPRKQRIGYSRFEHTMRVYKWLDVLYEAYPYKDKIDTESLIIATLFHDIGYCNKSHHKDHAEAGSEYCRRYLSHIDYKINKIDFICQLICMHSDKNKLQEDIPLELILIMEADLLDDTGAQSIVLDIWTNTINKDASFQLFLEEMKRVSNSIMAKNPMRTQKGKKLWEEKQRLVSEFISAYEQDISYQLPS